MAGAARGNSPVGSVGFGGAGHCSRGMTTETRTRHKSPLQSLIKCILSWIGLAGVLLRHWLRVRNGALRSATGESPLAPPVY